MKGYSTMTALVITLGACCHGPVHDPTCQSGVGNLGDAAIAVAGAVEGKYSFQLPPDFDARAYLAIAQGAVSGSRLELLRSVDLEVWTRPDCQGAIVVARCRETHRVIFIDDTFTTSDLEHPNALAEVNVEVPARPAVPPTCPLPAKP